MTPPTAPMENQLPSFLFLFTSLIFISMALRTWMNSKYNKHESKPPPPGPRKLPLIGNLHLFIGTQPHHCLSDLAHKYGPVMLLQLGEVPTVVISSAESAKQVMKTHDDVFAERPYLYAAEKITYSFQDIVFSRSEYRKQIRKICVLELLSQKRVRSFRPIREREICNMVKTIESREGSAINLKDLLYSSSLSILSRTAFGGRFNQQDAFKRILPDIVALFGGLSVVDVYPSVRLLHLINAMRPHHRRLHRESDEILERVIREHRELKLANVTKRENEVDDLVQVLLDIQDRGDNAIPLSNSSIKAILMDMFLAGAEPTSSIVEWAMSELLRCPEAMQKAQAEVRQVFNGKKDVDESGVVQLKYINLVIKETLRLHPPAPLLLPRECPDKFEIMGCTIPAKCRVIVNAWAIGRNHEYWIEPNKFDPDRFSESSISYKGIDFELIPFGAGKRMCPGMSYGIANVELILANLLYHFDWMLPGGMDPRELDMSEVFGASLRRKHDLCLVPNCYRFGTSEE